MMLTVDGLTHRYGEEHAVTDVSFDLAAGKLVALLGPSGCGKTTVVQAIAGHLRPTAGRIELRGREVTRDPPESRRVGLVFQESTVFPHLTVLENVAYGVRATDLSNSEQHKRVTNYLSLVGLDDQRDSYPAQLSGGQKRRVEFARALAPKPDVLLLDEPLSALDRGLREQLRGEIARIQRETGVTTLVVTHDQEDAMALADRLLVMNEGTVVGAGTPRDLYQSPPTPFVASFLGRSNRLSARVTDTDPLLLSVGERELRLNGETTGLAAGTDAVCHIRPHSLRITSSDTNGDSTTIPGKVVDVVDVGRRYDVTVRTPTDETVVVAQRDSPPPLGESVEVVVAVDDLTVFADTEAQTTEQPTEREPSAE